MAVATAEIPQAAPGTLDVGDAFTGLVKASGGWGAITIGGLLYLFSFLIVPWFLARGWLVAYGRAIAAGDYALPRWKLEYVWDGMRNVFVGFVYGLPMIAILSIFYAPFVIELIQSAQVGTEPNIDTFSRMFSGQLAVVGISQLFQFAVIGIRPAVDAVFLVDDRILPCFTPSRLMSVMRPFGAGYLLAPLIVYAASLVSGFGILLCCIGIVFTSFYLRAIAFNFAGQIARAQA